jgi:hypothetical protein
MPRHRADGTFIRSFNIQNSRINSREFVSHSQTLTTTTRGARRFIHSFIPSFNKKKDWGSFIHSFRASVGPFQTQHFLYRIHTFRPPVPPPGEAPPGEVWQECHTVAKMSL